MTRHEKEITREQYMRGVQNHGYIAEEDYETVFTDTERLGYGVYAPIVHEIGDRFFVHYLLGSTCD